MFLEGLPPFTIVVDAGYIRIPITHLWLPLPQNTF